MIKPHSIIEIRRGWEEFRETFFDGEEFNYKNYSIWQRYMETGVIPTTLLKKESDEQDNEKH